MADHDKKLALELCALDRPPTELDAVEVSIPGVLGLFVVLPGHAPLLSNIEIGEMSAVLPNGEERCFAVNAGFAQVLNDHVLILSQTAEAGHEIDVDRAEAARQRAEQRLKKRSEDIDVARAETALKRALTRLKVASKTPRPGE